MAENEYTSKFGIDISDLKKGMQQASQLIKVANSEFKAASGGMDNWGQSADGLSAKIKQLNTVNEAQKAKLELLEAEYRKVVAVEGENSKGAQDLYIKMNNLKGEIGKTESQIGKYSAKLDELENAQDSSGDSAKDMESAYDSLKSTISEQESELADLKTQYANVALEQGKDSESAKDLAKKIEDLSSELENNKSKLSEAENGYKDFGDSVEEQKTALDELKGAISDQESELSRLKTQYANVALEQGATSTEAQQLASKIQSLSGELKENKSKLSDAEDAADSFDSTLDDLGDSAEDASGGFSIMTGALAELVADGIKAAAEALKEFVTEMVTASSQANANFQAQTGASTAEMEKFGDSIQNVYDHNFGETMQDVADAMAEVKKQTGEIDPSKLEKMTENGITLRDTFGYEMNESMRAVNMLMKQFGLTSDEAFNFVVKGAQSGLDKNGDLLDTINEYGVHYAQQGYSADEFYNSLKNGAESGTFSVDKLGDAMKEFGIRSKDTATTTTEGFELLGFNADEMRAKFAQGGESAQSATQQVLGALFGLDDQVTQNQAGVDLFGTMWEDLGIDGVKALMDVSGEAVTTTGAMEDLTNVKYSDISSKIGEIGRTLKSEFLQPIVDQIKPAVESFVQFVIDNFNIMGPIIVGVGAAFGVLAAALGIQAIISGVQKAFLLLNTTMLANPIVLIVAAIAGLAAAFVALWNKSEGFRNFWIGLWDGIKSAASTAADWIVSAFEAVSSFFTETLPNALSSVSEFFSGIWESIKSVASSAASGIVSAFDSVVNFFTVTIPEIFNSVISFIQENWQSLLLLIVNPFAGAFKLLYDNCDGFREFVDGFIENVKTIFSNGITAIQTFFTETIPQIVSNVITWFSELPYNLGFLIGQALGTFIQWGINMKDKAIETGTNVLNSIVEFFTQLPGKILEFITNAYTNVTTWASNMWNKAKETGSNFLNSIVSFFQQLPGKVSSFISSVLSAVKTWASNMWNKAKETGSNFLNSIVSFFQQLPGKVSSFISSVFSAVTTWASNMASKAKEAGSNFLNNVVNFIQQLPGRVANFLSNIISSLVTWVSNMGTKGKEGAKSLFDSVVNGLAALPGEVLNIGTNIVQGLWNGISGAAGWLADKVKSFARGILDGMKSALGINSPSKVMRDMVGKFIPEGVAVGIENNAKTAVRAAQDMAKKLVPAAEGIVDSFSIPKYSANSMSAGAAGNVKGGNTYNFYQTNNSPKALSRLEIYRQTKNQLAFAKGV